MSTPIRISNDQIVAFRLSGHHLARRLPADRFLDAAAACGLQNSPPGSAGLALAVRVEGLDLAGFTRALESDKTLLQIRSMRGAPHVVPASDRTVFTFGLLPGDENELRAFIPGAGPGLDKVGISATTLVEHSATALLAALDGRTMAFRALSTELTERVGSQLPAGQLAVWQSPSGFAPGQSLGEALIHFALYPLALRGLYCYAGRAGEEAAFVHTDQWLGAEMPVAGTDRAQTELLRRYLCCYGPSTVQHFAQWAGVAPSAAQRAWVQTEHMLAVVDVDGQPVWCNQADLDLLTQPPTATGVRLVPPHDPYLALRDRAILVSDRSLQRRVWRPSGNPGVVLVNGRIAGLWRPQVKGKRWHVTVEGIAELSGSTRSGIATEVSQMAAWRGCTGGEVVHFGQGL